MTSAAGEHAKIAAIVILYLPTEKTLARLLQSLQGTVAHICVIDNTPTSQISWVSPAWFDANGFQVQYKALGDNFGIAKAQNVGIELAIQNECDHVILFDQDSVASPGMINTLLAEERLLLDQGVKVGSVGPAFIDEKTGDFSPAKKQGIFLTKRMPIHPGDTQAIEVDTLIASGCLIRMSVLDSVGLMLDELFIDWVDIEWALRAARLQYLHFMVTKAVMGHSIGDNFVNVGSLKFNIHNNIRKYYIVRNAFHLMLSPAMSWSWRINTCFKMIAYAIIYTISADKKMNMLQLLIRAVRDGFAGRLGKAAITA